MRVKTDYEGGEDLTPGKEYEVLDLDEEALAGYIVDDIGDRIFINIIQSSHVGFQAWEVVDG